jgi:hypothetical protein
MGCKAQSADIAGLWRAFATPQTAQNRDAATREGYAEAPKCLHRMLSPKGNPSMDNLAAIFGAVRNWLKVTFDVRVVEAAL